MGINIFTNMKKILTLLVFVCLFQVSFAQEADTGKTYRIGVFANLYLDSSFNGTTYKFSNQMPRHLLPGLDFAEGAMMAFDSLMVDQKIKVYLFDVRSVQQSVAKLKAQNIFDSLDMMIGAVTGADYKQMADIAFQKNIPFISATFPNDGGVTNNPYTIIINSTLPVHCEAIYNYIFKTDPTANIIYVRRKGVLEDRLNSYFDSYNKTTSGKTLLKWKTITIADSIKPETLTPYLDSTTNNLVICGSLDEKFGVQLIGTSNNLLKNYPIELIGMPTWEAMKGISNPEWKELPITYSTTFFNPGVGSSVSFAKVFSDKTFGRPSDLAYKGFETTWYFVNLLLKHNSNLLKNLNDKTFKVFTDYDFRPVLNKTSGKADYYENKRIYILRRNNGLVSRMN